MFLKYNSQNFLIFNRL